MVESLETKILDYTLEQEAGLGQMSGKTIFVLNGETGKGLKALSKTNALKVYQTHKTDYDALRADQIMTHFDMRGDFIPNSHDVIMVCLSKNKQENLFHIGFGLFLLKQGGTILCYGRNGFGVASYQKALKEVGMDEPNTAVKHKSRAFWVEKTGELDTALLSKWIAYGTFNRIADTQLEAIPGLFSADKIDKGSLLLCEYLPKKLDKMGADFGCGYGFLSYYILNQGIANDIVCVDNDHKAVDCARQNLNVFVDGKRVITFHWLDLVSDMLPKASLNWAVMNPPFHDDKEENHALGQAFIKNAAQALKKGGTLYMVANAHLPYEKILAANFSKVEKLTEKEGFKIFIATV
jgi:16S rRNA (guanine1207-N2)-methyltransferase